MTKTLLISNRKLLDHLSDIPHPESPERLRAVLDTLERSSVAQYLDFSCERMATREELELVHGPDYVGRVLALDSQYAWLDHETPLSPGSVRAARLAAGLGIEAVERIVAGKVERAFVLVRPPGHHSSQDVARGFCVFNNIAIASKRALGLGIKRILILDWDVHHGNGTQKIFYEDDRVMFIDLHQEGLFPHDSGSKAESGSGKGKGFTVNIPLPDSCFDEDFVREMDNQVIPIARRFAPELILVSAGFDAHEDDPMASMRISAEGFAQLTAKTKALANELCQGKLALFLEGGYVPEALADDVLKCAQVLCT